MTPAELLAPHSARGDVAALLCAEACELARMVGVDGAADLGALAAKIEVATAEALTLAREKERKTTDPFVRHAAGHRARALEHVGDAWAAVLRGLGVTL